MIIGKYPFLGKVGAGNPYTFDGIVNCIKEKTFNNIIEISNLDIKMSSTTIHLI